MSMSSPRNPSAWAIGVMTVPGAWSRDCLEDARAIIEKLDLQRHPEGGWYAETFRDRAGGERGHSTAIYYLLEGGDHSHWHRVIDAAEAWHHFTCRGTALPLLRSPPMAMTRSTANWGASDFEGGGERPQLVVPVPAGDGALLG